MKSRVSELELVRCMTTPGLDRPRGKGVHLNVQISGDRVEWDCPVCRAHNVQAWYGREYHICSKCEQPTEIKG